MRTLQEIVADLCEFHAEPHHRWDSSVHFLECLLRVSESEKRAQRLISEYLWTNYTKIRNAKFEELKRELFVKQMLLEKQYGV